VPVACPTTLPRSPVSRCRCSRFQRRARLCPQVRIPPRPSASTRSGLARSRRSWWPPGSGVLICGRCGERGGAAAVRAYPFVEGVKKDEVEKELGYFLNNAPRMRYHWFRSHGLFLGSGVVEARCKTVVGQRLKQAGIHWTVNGADAIIAIRCKEASGTWEAACDSPALRRAPPDQGPSKATGRSPQY